MLQITTMQKLIEKDLPNFPLDIIDQWIVYHAEDRVWPPAATDGEMPNSDWILLLKEKPLSYWKSIEWKEEKFKIEKNDFDLLDASMIVNIINAYTKGEFNNYSLDPGFYGFQERPRFDTILDYLIENGELPRKPIVLKQENHLEVVDGFHRLAAYFTARDEQLVFSYSKKLPKVPINEWVGMWVGYS